MLLSQAGPARARAAVRPRGFTLVELLVVIAIIGTLVALLLPAVQMARETARKAECLNNIKQIATGMINYETNKEEFPGYLQQLRRSSGEYLVIDTTNGVAGSVLTSVPESNRAQSWISWAGVLTPFLERQDLYDNMVDGGVNSPAPLAQVVPIETLVCPSDTELKSLAGAAGLSYSVNAGTWDFEDFQSPDDWIQPGPNTGDTKDNGMFHNLSLGDVRTTLSGVRDGAATTLLAAENNHKEIEDSGPVYQYCWLGVQDFQFGEQQFGVVWTVDLNPSALSVGAQNFQYPISVEDALPYDVASPRYARPASEHSAGAVNVVFVDGHGDTLAADIDYTVYQRLMTPNGRECVDPQSHSNLSVVESTNPTGFRLLAPLSEDDF